MDTNVSPFARARNIYCGHKICVRDTKMFLISFRIILCPQQMFPGLRNIETIMSNNVSATLCPRLPPQTTKYIVFEHVKVNVTIICGEKSNHGYKYRFFEDARTQLEKSSLNFSSCKPFPS